MRGVRFGRPLVVSPMRVWPIDSKRATFFASISQLFETTRLLSCHSARRAERAPFAALRYVAEINQRNARDSKTKNNNTMFATAKQPIRCITVQKSNMKLFSLIGKWNILSWGNSQVEPVGQLTIRHRFLDLTQRSNCECYRGVVICFFFYFSGLSINHLLPRFLRQYVYLIIDIFFKE